MKATTGGLLERKRGREGGHEKRTGQPKRAAKLVEDESPAVNPGPGQGAGNAHRASNTRQNRGRNTN